VLVAIAIPFLAVYYRDRRLWWALIPAYVLIAIGLMVALIGLGVLGDLLVPSYVMFAIAIPFFFVYFRNRKLWWALIPAGILAVIGVAFLIAEAAFAYIGALVLILVGGWMLLRAFTRKEPAAEAAMPEPEPAVEDSGMEEGEL
jgi:predicted membrane protein